MAPPAIARAKLEAVGVEWLLEQLEHGRSYRDIAREVGVSTMSLHDHLNDNPVHSARAEAALRFGAEAHEAEAVRVLTDTYNMLESADSPHPHASALASLARERAQAAWRAASVRDRARYSDSRTQQISVDIRHHDVAQLPTADLERLVAQHSATLELQHDGSVTPGGTSDSGEAGE